MPKKSSRTITPRIPEQEGGIQVNFCKNPRCKNFGVPAKQKTSKKASESDDYVVVGTGGQKPGIKCKACGNTFAVGKSTRGQKAPEKNRQIFMEVVNGNPINRICELANVRAQTVYDKIDFFQEQCLKFLGDKERRLKAGLPIEKLYLSSDRQYYIVNWTHRKDKRTTQLSAVGTADNESGYVFGMHLNFDPDADPIATEAAAHVAGDYHVKRPFRQFARLWLAQDYGSEKDTVDTAPQKITSGNLSKDIEYAYNVVAHREDTEISNRIPATHKLPVQGMQIHAEYTLYGKRLGNYIFPSLYGVFMMSPSKIDIQGVHHETELIEKRDQPPALA